MDNIYLNLKKSYTSKDILYSLLINNNNKNNVYIFIQKLYDVLDLDYNVNHCTVIFDMLLLIRSILYNNNGKNYKFLEFDNIEKLNTLEIKFK